MTNGSGHGHTGAGRQKPRKGKKKGEATGAKTPAGLRKGTMRGKPKN